MRIVEVFLPLDRGDGSPIEPDLIGGFVAGLADRFGGATAYSRAPADGVWKGDHGLERDRILVIEVMLEALDEAWWRAYRSRLEAELGQEQILIRVTDCWKV